jgi:transposase
MMLLPPLEEFIPSDHPVRRLNKVLDLSFVHEAVRDHYCQNNGRPSIDPEVIIRLFLLQAIFNIPHVRELMRQVQVNLAYRWFIGYQLDEKLPDHSTLSKALDRFGDDVFNELFARSIELCGESGLIEGRMLHIDATSIRADLDKNKVKCADRADKDAAFGRFADGTYQPGYKQQTAVDDQAGVVVGLSVQPANESDEQAGGGGCVCDSEGKTWVEAGTLAKSGQNPHPVPPGGRSDQPQEVDRPYTLSSSFN